MAFRADGNQVQICGAMGDILNRIGDKWSVMIVGHLSRKTMRFNELRHIIGGISQRMLTLTLRNLERDGLVSRTVTPSIPPRVDYELTDLGCSLLKPVNAVSEWALANVEEIHDAQARFDIEHDARSLGAQAA